MFLGATLVTYIQAFLHPIHRVSAELIVPGFGALRFYLLTFRCRTYISPIYLRSTDGKRFLAYLFGLHPSLITDIHAVMKEQMIGAKRGVLSAYGEVRA